MSAMTGIGASIIPSPAGGFEVSSLSATGNARLHLQVGDRIISIGSVATSGKTDVEVKNLILGPSGSTISMVVARGSINKPISFSRNAAPAASSPAPVPAAAASPRPPRGVTLVTAQSSNSASIAPVIPDGRTASTGRYNADDAATKESVNAATEAAPAPESLSSGVVSCSIERGAIEPVHPQHPRTFRQRLFAILFAQRLPSNIELGQPDMSLKWMSRKHVLRLSRQLRVRAHAGITSLDLSGQALGASGMRILARSITKLTGLEDLDLSFNLIGDGAKGAGYLSTALGALTRLKSLDISANNFVEHACCAILHVILNIRSLEHVDMGNGTCDSVDYYVSSTSWRTANFVQPPPEVIAGGWDRVIAFLRAGPCLPMHELRLMLIGHGEVGKSSLVESFAAPNHMAARISKVDRTVGIVRKPLVLNSRSGPEITCEVCDCAGQEIYHLSHTLYFTRRCLYLLMWSPHKFADDGTAQALSEDEVVAPLKRWLQLLAANIPEATVMIVGTHSQIDPEVFQSMRTRVDFHVKEEIHRLHVTAKNEADKTGQIIQQQEVKFKEICGEIDVALSKHNLKHGTLLALPKYENYLMHHNLQGHEKFVNFLLALQPQLNRSLRLKTQELRDFMQVMTETRLRLCKLYAKHGSSVIFPKDAVDLAKLKFLNELSFAVDSVDGVGIETLLHAIEATCRDPAALPFLSEPVPVHWFQVKEALMQRTLSYDIGDCVLPLEDAAVRIRNVLKNRDNFGERVADDSSGDLDDENWETCSSDDGDSDKNSSSTETPSAAGSELLPSLHNPEEDEEEDGWETCEEEVEDTMIQELDVQKSLEFWSLLGRVFVYNGYFLRDPWHVMTLMKPLVHHHVISMKFCEEYCVGSFDAMKECLVQLHQRSLLDHRLLSHFNHWAELSLEARQSMLMFFKECFIISDLCRGSASHGDVSLVTARLCSPGDTDIQDRIAAEAADIERESEHCAVYTISSAHIGLIARMQAAIAPFVQPCRIDLHCGKDHICMSRFSRLKCSVSVRRLEEVFESNMHSLSKMVSIDEFSHGFIICSNDCGLFAFAAQFVDKIMQTCVFGSLYQIWLRLPCRPGAARQPMSTDWVQLRTTDIPKSLFEMLSANVGDMVSPSRNLRLKDISPRKSPIFMSRTCSGDGTGEFCLRIKDALQEKLLCTVWFDKREIDWMGLSVDEMQMGIRDACVFVICLTPLYLTRPHCLRQLRWILDMCTSVGSKKKRILVLPLHPAVSVEGCRKIIKAAETQRPAHVFLRVDDRVNVPPCRLGELKGHKLSDDAILLLTQLVNQCCESFQSDWVKLQPWLSDELGADWEEVSSVWAEQKHVSIDELLAASVPDMLNLLAAPSESVELGFTGLDPQNLVADPPSQESFSSGNVDVICECYPNSRSVLSEQELVAVVHLGLHDEDIMSCIEHGYGEFSVSEELGDADMAPVNPINVVSRIAAHMSGANFLGPQIKEARRVMLSDVLAALSTPDFVEMFLLRESPWNFLELMRALSRKLLIQPDARVFTKNAVVIMEKYIELFTEACSNHMKSENERVQRERRLEIENMQAAREQREQALVALLEEAEPKKAECLGCNELKYPWVSCGQGHILCGDCFSGCVSAQVARVHAVEHLEFLRSRDICCSCCKAVGNVFVFDMHTLSHLLSCAVWGQYLSALEAYWIAEAEKSFTKREKELQAQQQSLQMTLDCHKQQEWLSNTVKHIRENLIIPECPYREGNTSNKCSAKFLSDFEGCSHIKCPKCGKDVCGWCINEGINERQPVEKFNLNYATHMNQCPYQPGGLKNRDAYKWKFGVHGDAGRETVWQYLANRRICKYLGDLTSVNAVNKAAVKSDIEKSHPEVFPTKRVS